VQQSSHSKLNGCKLFHRRLLLCLSTCRLVSSGFEEANTTTAINGFAACKDRARLARYVTLVRTRIVNGDAMAIDRRMIVTLNSVPDVSEGGLERRIAVGATERVLRARYHEFLRRLEQATADAGSSQVMVTVQNREISLIQSELAPSLDGTRPAAIRWS